LADAISAYLSHLPGAPPVEEIDGEAILRDIEAHHGVLVERAHNIHSFSHLSFQEYFTARYIVENEARGTTTRLIRDHLTDQRWRETLLLTASLLDNADSFTSAIQSRIDEGVGDGWLLQTLNWADAKIQAMDGRDGERPQYAALRLAYIYLARATALATALARALALAHALEIDLTRSLALALTRDLTRSLALALTRDLTRSLDLALALARKFHPEVGVDYALYYGWAIAELLTLIAASGDKRSQFLRDFPQLIDFCQEVGAKRISVSLSHLPFPRSESDETDWRALTNGIWKIMQEERGFLPPRAPSREEYDGLNDYFYANELLVRCLDLAYVTNRQAILDNLLRLPGALTTP